jgi:O-antigen/teichoic acid export membrane protein
MPAEPILETPRALKSGALLSSTSRVGVAVTGAIATIVLARVLGDDGWAGYFVAQSLILLLLAGTTLGVEHGIAYYVSSGTWRASSAFSSALKVAACMGFVGVCAGLAARLLFPSAFAGLSVWETAIVVAALPFALVLQYTSYLALAVDRYEVATSLPMAQALLVLVLAVPGAVAFGVSGAVVGLTLATLFVGTAAIVWGRRRLPSRGADEEGQLGRAMSFGLKAYAANALQLANYRLDLFVLSAVAATAAVGSYSLAVALTSLLWLLPRAVSDVLYPRVARFSREGEEDQRELVERKSLRHVSLVTIVSALLVVAVLEVLVVPVFGEEFRPAVNLGLILVPGAAAIAVSSVLAATVVGRGKPAYSLYVALVITPLTIGLYAIVIPWLEEDGAAIASTVSYLGTFLLWCVLYGRATGRSVFPLLVPTRSELRDLRGLWPRPDDARASDRS